MPKGCGLSEATKDAMQDADGHGRCSDRLSPQADAALVASAMPELMTRSPHAARCSLA